MESDFSAKLDTPNALASVKFEVDGANARCS
jgi:hypothetical protein